MIVITNYETLICQIMTFSNKKNVGQAKSIKNLTNSDKT